MLGRFYVLKPTISLHPRVQLLMIFMVGTVLLVLDEVDFGICVLMLVVASEIVQYIILT